MAGTYTYGYATSSTDPIANTTLHIPMKRPPPKPAPSPLRLDAALLPPPKQFTVKPPPAGWKRPVKPPPEGCTCPKHMWRQPPPARKPQPPQPPQPTSSTINVVTNNNAPESTVEPTNSTYNVVTVVTNNPLPKFGRDDRTPSPNADRIPPHVTLAQSRPRPPKPKPPPFPLETPETARPKPLPMEVMALQPPLWPPPPPPPAKSPHEVIRIKKKSLTLLVCLCN